VPKNRRKANKDRLEGKKFNRNRPIKGQGVGRNGAVYIRFAGGTFSQNKEKKGNSSLSKKKTKGGKKRERGGGEPETRQTLCIRKSLTPLT